RLSPCPSGGWAPSLLGECPHFAQALIAQNAGPHALCDSVRVPSYLLRVQLEDRPGSLGSLAVALGSVGADILSLDVVERGAGYWVEALVGETNAARVMRSTTSWSNCRGARCPTR